MAAGATTVKVRKDFDLLDVHVWQWRKDCAAAAAGAFAAPAGAAAASKGAAAATVS